MESYTTKWQEWIYNMKPIRNITQEAFAPYGNVIEFPKDFEGNYYIVDAEEEKPWILAVFRYENKGIQRIEKHPTSKESFEPLDGVTLLLVAEEETPEEYEVFLLEQPVCLKKGTWHQVLALTPSASVKITENKDVYSVYYDLPKEITATIS